MKPGAFAPASDASRSEGVAPAPRPTNADPTQKCAPERLPGKGLVASLSGIGTGWLTVSIFYNAWDFVLFPFTVWRLGPLWGGILMGFADLLVCLVLILAYVSQKRDWLGFELAKQWIGSLDSSRWAARILKQSVGSPILAFLVLSWRYDPFVTTAYFSAPGSGAISRQRWQIFGASWLLGNSAWTFVCFGGIELVEAAMSRLG